MEQVKELGLRRDQLEKELEYYLNTLESLGVGMEGGLLDSEGFPRADIDLYVVRESRQKVAMLRNDLKAIMKDIEQGLHELHAQARAAADTAPSS